jgi:signal transduction histidine kinase
MIYSRRLTGLMGQIIFLTMILPSLLSTTALHEARPAMRYALIALVLIYMAVTTVGWVQILNSRSSRRLQAYFVLTLGLVTVFNLGVASVTGEGTSEGLIALVPVLQSAVLAPRARWVIGLLALLGFGVANILFGSLALAFKFTFPLSFGVLGFSFVGSVIVGEETARQKADQLAEELDQTNKKLIEYADEIESLSTARERNRLAREIHDNLGHYLTAINMQTQAALAILDADRDRAVDALHKVQALTKEGLGEIRRSIAAMQPSVLADRSLYEALLVLVEESRAAGLPVELQIEADRRPCSAQIEMALYRTAQEGLTNMRKHAQATQATLVLSYAHENRVALTLQDNGVGSEKQDEGFGLIGIRERVHLLGGSLTIRTAPNQGFVLEVEIPT